MSDFSRVLQNWYNARAATLLLSAEPSWPRSPLAYVLFSETWIAEAGIRTTSLRYLQTQFSSEAEWATRERMRVRFLRDVMFSVRASKVPTTMPHVHQLNLVFDGKLKPEMLLERLSNTKRVVVIPYEDVGRKHDWTSEILEAFVSSFERPISPEIFELLFSDAIIPFELGDHTILQTVMLVEQMSLPVPNYVEAYLLFCGFPADRVHGSVDSALGVVHGVWPDKLS